VVIHVPRSCFRVSNQRETFNNNNNDNNNNNNNNNNEQVLYRVAGFILFVIKLSC
jgi:hypothetical protein